MPVPHAPVATAPARVEHREQRLSKKHWGLLLLAGWLFQAGLRAWLGRGASVPLANPDETAYLIAARVLAGGAGANLGHSTLYPVGYPLLISPVFWFTKNPVTAYHGVVLVNSLVSALLMPLSYVACRRLGLTSRPLAYGVAMVTALLPAGLFYSEYAMSDAIFPVLVLAWLLTTHSWLIATTERDRYLAAAGSALLTGYAYAVHSRGAVLVAGYLGVLVIMVLWRRHRGSAILAGSIVVGCCALAFTLNRLLESQIYPQGPRSMTAEVAARLGTMRGIILVLEMATGQMWRLSLDSWGVAALGMAAVVVAIARSRQYQPLAVDTRIIACLALAITLAIAITTPAALPADQPQQWASGRYLDCMIVTFFLPGMVVLLRAGRQRLLIYALCVAPPTMIAAIIVDAYATSSVPTLGFGAAFNFGEPAFLTGNWTQANVALATAVALGLLAVWVAVAALLPSARVWVLLVGLTAVSVTADVQMTDHITNANQQIARATEVQPLAGLRPGQQLAISTALGWQLQTPQMYEMSWTGQVFFTPVTQSPPAGVTEVEVPWLNGQSEQASWPTAPPGWHIADGSATAGWVVWETGTPAR